MYEFSMRLACPDDAKALAELNLAFNGVEESPLRIREKLQTTETMEPGSEMVAVAVIRNEIVGFACAYSRVSFCYPDPLGEITEMYVKKEFRKKGIASSLLAFLEKELAKIGVKELTIVTGRENLPAQATYTASGYTLDDDDVVFHKELKKPL